MTHLRTTEKNLTIEEWNEMIALKDAININPATVHPDKMELFTSLLVKSLEGKGDDQTPKI